MTPQLRVPLLIGSRSTYSDGVTLPKINQKEMGDLLPQLVSYNPRCKETQGCMGPQKDAYLKDLILI